ncbi:hypothetical protein [Porticoccus hydrocarbonoclasticus]|uniref:hypothetical protein n=1 Tax=Porticoccus hydrocarbonoclasticus TaxID=1073414 RepID=UPI002353094C|nr:hypothetical protein [Porticoccus hydrocarbonoclasticus]|tara:strand:+ start:4050 stop:5642 length:1593 start_codon:yes stop_codon:yes gene_type:complete
MDILKGKKHFSAYLIFLVFFILVCILNWDARYEKPVWDTVGGVFAPAIYLYETGFDFRALLNEPGFPQAGPNVHVYSPITFVTAAVMWLFDGGRAPVYLSLHLIQFALTAMLLTVVFSLSRTVFGVFTALLITVAVVLFPPFLIQSRYMYMEIGGSLCVILAFSNWVKKNYFWSAIAAIGACIVKSFGLPVAVCLALLFMFEKGEKAKRFTYILMMVVLGAGVELLRWMQGTNMAPANNTNYIGYLIHQFHSRLTQTPDFYLILLFLIIGGWWYLLKNGSALKGKFVLEGQEVGDIETGKRVLLGGILMVSAFVGFIGVVPLSGMGFYPLTRYYIWIWPVMVITLVALISCGSGGSWRKNKKDGYAIKLFVNVVVLAMIGLFWCNKAGEYYPNYGKDITAFSIAERSMEYISFNEMQSSLLRSAENINDQDVYLNLFDTYYASSPIMGYIDDYKENFRNILTYHNNQADLSEYPDNFALVLSNISHGGQYMSALIYQALKAPDKYEVKILDNYNIDGFTGSIVGISKVSN